MIRLWNLAMKDSQTRTVDRQLFISVACQTLFGSKGIQCNDSSEVVLCVIDKLRHYASVNDHQGVLLCAKLLSEQFNLMPEPIVHDGLFKMTHKVGMATSVME